MTRSFSRFLEDSVLETPRLVLRPMRAGDVDDLLGVFGDPRVMAAFDEPPFDRARMERWVRRNLDHQAHDGYGLFTLVRKSDGIVVGDCGLERMDEGGIVQAELGYDLRADCWGRGLATEAAAAVRDHAFTALGLPRLISLVQVGNLASRRVAEKIGMRLDAEVTRHGRRYWLMSLDAPGTVAAAPG
ncbi:MAG TPA: GNAT family N-acetyltransferase [Thermomicrobiaceae bacterium]|nr:GNAT family N-acetyltransferase [Thermomicrobiaceae bacterium]